MLRSCWRGAKSGHHELTFAILGTATRTCALLVSSQFTQAAAQTIQQSQTMTATASAPAKSDACIVSRDKAYGLCMARGFFNIISVSCDCNQRNVPQRHGNVWGPLHARNRRLLLVTPLLVQDPLTARWATRSRSETAGGVHLLLMRGGTPRFGKSEVATVRKERVMPLIATADPGHPSFRERHCSLLHG